MPDDLKNDLNIQARALADFRADQAARARGERGRPIYDSYREPRKPYASRGEAETAMALWEADVRYGRVPPDTPPPPSFEASNRPQGGIPESQITFRNPESGKVGAYHGSPHRFEAFSMEKVGTGEGAQAYGHGLYFAENPNVARAYREELTGGVGPNSPAGIARQRKGGSPHLDQAHIEAAKDIRANGIDQHEALTRLRQAYPNAHLQDLTDARDLIYGNRGGAMYHVEIDAEPHQFLDWDKPLSQQSPEVQRAVREILADPDMARSYGGERFEMVMDRDGTARYSTANDLGDGAEFYNFLTESAGRNQTEASAKLRAAGIKGIRYLDQGSRAPSTAVVEHFNGAGARARADAFAAELRAKGLSNVEVSPRGPNWRVTADEKQTSNYVVFDDRLVRILNREGFSGTSLLGPLAGGIAAGTAVAARATKPKERERP